MNAVEFYIVGAGVSFPDHLSIESIDVMGRCDTICTNIPKERLSTLPPDLQAKTRSLWNMYVEGRRRSDNYNDVVEEVLRISSSAGRAAWLSPGHPLIFDSVSNSLLSRARANGWTVSLLPAISCIDTILAEVEYDPAGGLLVHEATGLVNRRIPIPRGSAVLLLQPSVFNIDRAVMSLKNEQLDLRPLRDYLVAFFGPSHRCAFVRSGSRFGGSSSIVWTTIEGIPGVAYGDIAGSTLFIPRIEEPAPH